MGKENYPHAPVVLLYVASGMKIVQFKGTEGNRLSTLRLE